MGRSGVKPASETERVVGKASARALHDSPRFNASLSSDGKTLVLKDYVHIGIAVGTPNGLTAPVLRDADQKGLWQIAAEITDLAGRAQECKVRMDEMVVR